MTYKEAYNLLEDFVLTYSGWVPAGVFEALDKLRELAKPPELQSGVATQTYHMAAIPIDPDVDARVEEMARKARKSE